MMPALFNVPDDQTDDPTTKPPLRLPTAPTAFAPPAQSPPFSQPGIFHRLAAGFGAPRMDPMAAEWMDPAQQKYLRSQGQSNLAAALMQASGPRPQGTANFTSRLGEAFGASNANWQEIQQNASQRAMQSIQFGWQVQARDMLTKALQENPEPEVGASPADKAARLSRIASRLAMAGPLGAEYAKQYGELARMILEGSPLSAQQQNDIWTKAIGPSENAAHAWDQFRGLSGKYDRIAIAQRAMLADQIMNPDKPAQGLGAYQNPDVVERIPGIGPILAAALRIGRISPDDAAYLDKYVSAEAERARVQAQHVLEHQRLIGEHGALGSSWKGYYNPFDQLGLGPAKSAAPPPGQRYRVVMRNGRLVKVPIE